MPNLDTIWLQRGVLALGAVVLVWVIHRFLAFVIRRAATTGRLSRPVAATLRRATALAAVVGGLILVLQAVGLLQSAMAALTALFAMIAIGFVAVWSVASNVSCSLIMLVTQPFRVGDEIELPPDPIGGTVVNFNMLYTTLRAEDDTLLQIPNNMFFQRVIKRRPGSGHVTLEDQLPQREDATV